MFSIRPGRKIWLAINVTVMSILIIGYRFGLLYPLFSSLYKLIFFVGLYNLFFILSFGAVREWGDAYAIWGCLVNAVFIYTVYFSKWVKYGSFFMLYLIFGILSFNLLRKKFFRLIIIVLLVPGLYLSSPKFDQFLFSAFLMVLVAFHRDVVITETEGDEREDWRKTSDRLLEQLEVVKYSNRRLETKLAMYKKKLDDMEILQRIRNVLSRYEWEEAISRVLRILKSFNGASFVAVFSVDPIGSELTVAYHVGKLPSELPEKGKGVIGRVWETEKVAFSVKDKDDVKVCFPLKTSERLLGMLCMDRWRWYPDRRMAVHFLRPVADDIASFWQMQLWRRRISNSLKEADLLYKLSFLLTTNRNEKELIESVLDVLSEEFSYSAATYFSWDTEKEKLVPFIIRGSSRPVNIYTDRRFKEGEGVAAIAIMQKKTVAVNDVKDVVGIRSIIAVPIISTGRTMGVLTVARKDVRMFEEDEVRLLELAGMQVAYIIERVRLYQLLEKMAILDGLTGVYNHRYFKIRFAEELKRAKRYTFPLSLIIFDIDHFKKFNDTYGHQVGDLVLKHVVRVIKDGVRDIDIVARYGGEEFVAVLPYAGKEDAVMIADRVRESVWKSPIGVEEKLLAVTVSAGVSSYPVDAESVDELIRIADERLYMAKESGRNRVKG